MQKSEVQLLMAGISLSFRPELQYISDTVTSCFQ